MGQATGRVWYILEPVHQRQWPGAGEPARRALCFWFHVQLTALPAPGSYLFGWAGAASGFDNSLLFSVTNASGITALFGVLKSNQVSLTVVPSGNGIVAVNPAQNVYTNGDTVKLTAVPATNYVFSGWGGDVSGESNPLLLTFGTSKLVTASFALVTTTNLPPVVQSVELTSGKLNFTWSAVAGQEYQVQYKTDLLQSAWNNSGSAIVATNSTASASASFGSGPQQFYRIARLP